MEADIKLAWFPTSIKKLPTPGLESGVEPKVVAIDCTTGNTIPPPRAVLLGTNGASNNSTIYIFSFPSMPHNLIAYLIIKLRMQDLEYVFQNALSLITRHDDLIELFERLSQDEMQRK